MGNCQRQRDSTIGDDFIDELDDINHEKITKLELTGDTTALSLSTGDYDANLERTIALAQQEKLLRSRAVQLLEKIEIDSSSSQQLQQQQVGRSDHSTRRNKARRKLRRKLAKISADSKGKWLLFNTDEVYEEESLKKLSIFLEIAMRYIPLMVGSEESTQEEEEILPSIVINIPGDISSPTVSPLTRIRKHPSSSSPSKQPRVSISHSDRGSCGEGEDEDDLIQVDRRLSFGNLSLEDGSNATIRVDNNESSTAVFEENQTYPLHSQQIDMTAVTRIIDIYRCGAKLSITAVQSILRQGYRILSRLPNVSYATITAQEKLTVVGDLHGQLSDLLHILDESGLPNQSHRYVFNGDFVDRGDKGVEVMCLLLAMLIAVGPQHVILNRGNHEDFVICSIYGFQKEVLAKYDETTFAMFIEIFSHMPLYGVINDAIFIVHGGLFHQPDITIQQLERIDRYDCSLLDSRGAHDSSTIARLEEVILNRQLQKEALWSDPRDVYGIGENTRGAGVSFGPDITQQFLSNNRLQLVVRSHECVKSGYSRPYVGCGTEYENLLCTLFSASSYSDGNTAAYMEIFHESNPVLSRRYPTNIITRVDTSTVLPPSGLVYVISHYNTMNIVHYQQQQEDGLSELDIDTVPTEDCCDDILIGLDRHKLSGGIFSPSGGTPLASPRSLYGFISPPVSAFVTPRIGPSPQQSSIASLIHHKRMILNDAFCCKDADETGLISEDCFTDIMQHVLKFKIDWLALLPPILDKLRAMEERPTTATVAAATAVMTREGEDSSGSSSGSDEDIFKEGGNIDYVNLLNLFADIPLSFEDDSHDEDTAAAAAVESSLVAGVLYCDALRLLKCVYCFLSSSGGESISREAFMRQCQLLNEFLKEKEVMAATVASSSSTTCSLDDIRMIVDPSIDGSGSSVPSECVTLPLQLSEIVLQEIFDIMDVKECGEVDFNLFSEAFRVSNEFSSYLSRVNDFHAMGHSSSEGVAI